MGDYRQRPARDERIMATKIQINDEESIEVSSVLTGTIDGSARNIRDIHANVVGKYEVI
jgi:hypothetical protein